MIRFEKEATRDMLELFDLQVIDGVVCGENGEPVRTPTRSGWKHVRAGEWKGLFKAPSGEVVHITGDSFHLLFLTEKYPEVFDG